VGINDIGHFSTMLDAAKYLIDQADLAGAHFVQMSDPETGTILAGGGEKEDLSDAPFKVTNDGAVYATEFYKNGVPIGGGGGGSQHQYFTEEQVVGTWTDGSNVYEKSYQFTLASDSSYSIQTLDTIANMNNVWIKEGYGINTYSNAKYSSVIGLYNSNPTETDVAGYLSYNSNNELKFEYRCGQFMHGGTAHLTIRYTKTS